MTAAKRYDIIIIGAGPIGLACALEAKNKNLSYMILEKGCLVNSLYNYPLSMTFFSTADKLEIGNVPFISQGVKPNRAESLEYYRRVAMSAGLIINLYEEVISVEDSSGQYTVKSSKATYSATYIVIATGFYDIPHLMGIRGESLPKVHHYYKEAHPFFGQKVCVIGGANSAVDVALETYRKGAEVTMVVREHAISTRVKYWVRPDIENRLKEGTIKAYFNAMPTEITKDTVNIAVANESITIANDVVLAMTGYMPDFTFLQSLGIQHQDPVLKTPVYNEHTMETNQRNIYLAGVICGGMETHKWFIENSRVHAQMIMQDIVNKRKQEKVQVALERGNN